MDAAIWVFIISNTIPISLGVLAVCCVGAILRCLADSQAEADSNHVEKDSTMLIIAYHDDPNRMNLPITNAYVDSVASAQRILNDIPFHTIHGAGVYDLKEHRVTHRMDKTGRLMACDD